MIYLKTGVGIELQGEDLLISSIQSNFSGGAYTHFTRIAGFRTREREDVRREVDRFFKSNGIPRDNIILGFPRKDVVFRRLDLPAEVSDNLQQVVQYQVQSFIPVEDDPYCHDFISLQKEGAPAGKKISLIVAMIRKALVEETLALLIEAGIKPIEVTCSSIGLANLFLKNKKSAAGKTFILGNVWPAGLETLVLRDGMLLYSREAAKDDNVSWRDFLLRGINEAMSDAGVEQEGELEKIVLAGESSEAAYQEMKAVTDECDLIKDCLDLEIQAECLPYVQESAASLGLAYTGFVRRPAMKINLLPTERRSRQSRWAYVPAAVFGAAIILLLCAFALHQTVQDRRLAKELDLEIKKLEPSVKRVEGLRSQSELLDKKAKSIGTLLSKKDPNLDILRVLTTTLPQDTYLNTYVYRDGTITISGESGSANDLVPKLDSSPLLKDVVIRGGITKNAITGKERFQLDAKLER
jgi:Tfp pilus assembly protein PilN